MRMSSAILKASSRGTFLPCHGEEAVVRDDDEGVDVRCKLLLAHFRLLHLAFSLEGEGLRDNAHGQGSHFPRDLRHDGGGSRAGPAAHARGDEHHVGALQRRSQLVFALAGSVPADLGVSACAEAPGELAADLHPKGEREDFSVWISVLQARKSTPSEACVDHVVHCIAAATPDTDHLDLCPGISTFSNSNIFSSSMIVRRPL
jgi:hypothetical protein